MKNVVSEKKTLLTLKKKTLQRPCSAWSSEKQTGLLLPDPSFRKCLMGALRRKRAAAVVAAGEHHHTPPSISSKPEC